MIPGIDPMNAVASSITSLAGSNATPGLPSAGQAAAPAPFADLMTDAVGQVGALENQAHAAVTGLMSGNGVDVHQAMSAKGALGNDMVHPSDMGYALMARAWYKALTGEEAPAIADPKNPLMLPPPIVPAASVTPAPAGRPISSVPPIAPWVARPSSCCRRRPRATPFRASSRLSRPAPM